MYSDNAQRNVALRIGWGDSDALSSGGGAPFSLFHSVRHLKGKTHGFPLPALSFQKNRQPESRIRREVHALTPSFCLPCFNAGGMFVATAPVAAGCEYPGCKYHRERGPDISPG